MSVRLSKGVVTFELSNPELGDLDRLDKRQVVQARSDGGVYVYELASDGVRDRELQFNNLRRAERDNLWNFFNAVARGAMEPWTFTDERGENWNARFLDSTLEFTAVQDDVSGGGTFIAGGVPVPTTTRSGGYYSTKFRLRIW